MGNALHRDVERIREFNRFYTQRIGVMKRIEGDLSLPTARVLFEIAHANGSGNAPAAVDIAQRLGLDAGYVSRLLQQVERKGLVQRRRSTTDGRRRELDLTEDGRKIYEDLTERTRAELSDLVEPLTSEQRRDLLTAMGHGHSLAATERVETRALRLTGASIRGPRLDGGAPRRHLLPRAGFRRTV